MEESGGPDVLSTAVKCVYMRPAACHPGGCPPMGTSQGQPQLRGHKTSVDLVQGQQGRCPGGEPKTLSTSSGFQQKSPQLAREAHFLGPQTTLRLPQADKSPVTQKPGIRSQGEASG